MITASRARQCRLALAICAALMIAPAAADAAPHHGPSWRRALELRSEALNKKYHLGRYAHVQPGTSVEGFDWGAAAVGAGGAAAAFAVVAGVGLTAGSARIRKRPARPAGRTAA
jgi:Na+(H+)/acetate symporter ActP